MTMPSNIKVAIISFILTSLYFPLLSFGTQEKEAPEELREQAAEVAHPTVRSINNNILQELQNDPDMDYYISTPDDSLWINFRNWFFRQLLELFGTREAVNNLEIIFYSIALLALTYAILRLLKVDLSGLLGRKARRAILDSEEGEQHEDFNEIDFASALEEALKANDFNKAIRLLYLSALKELTEREHIRWQSGKTNYQYQQELQVSHLQGAFRKLGYFFEYAWYGNFRISEHQYKEAERSYQSLQQNLQQPALK